MKRKTEGAAAANGWPRVPLRDVVAEAQAGFASGMRDHNGVIQLRMNNVDTRGMIDLTSYLRVPCSADRLDIYRLQRGDVLFNNTNSAELVGKSAMFLGYDEPVVYSNHFTRLRPKPDALNPEYLVQWLQCEWQRRTFENICNRWIGQAGVKWDKLGALIIPLPPLVEQRRIASHLNEQMAHLARARAAAEQELALIDALPAALLREAFGASRST